MAHRRVGAGENVLHFFRKHHQQRFTSPTLNCGRPKMVEIEVFDDLILILQPTAKMDSAHQTCISRLDCRLAMCVFSSVFFDYYH